MNHYEKLPKVWVRDNEEEDWELAYLLSDVLNSYCALRMCDGRMYYFNYMTTEDPYAKKARRLMNEAEFMELRKENPQIVFSALKSPRDWYVNFNYSDFAGRSVHQYSLDLVNWNDFYVEVEE